MNLVQSLGSRAGKARDLVAAYLAGCHLKAPRITPRAVVRRKVWRDLLQSRLRTAMVVLSTTVGVFALGLVFGLAEVISATLTADHQATIPAHLSFHGGPFDAEAIDAVLGESGVARADGELYAAFRWKWEGEPDWRNGTLVARANYTSQQMNLVNLVEGAWPTDRALSVERQSSRYFGLSPYAGDLSSGASHTIIVQFGRSDRKVSITGVVRSPLVYPPQFGGDAAFYATPEAVTWLTGLDGFNQINVVLDTFSQANADEVAQRVERRLRRMGFVTNGHIVTDPERHWFQDTIDAILAVLLVLGALAVFLSAFLIVNTMHALISQQTWQIGVMKVLGATFKQVFTAYLSTAAIYGALALCVAVPLGIVGAHLVARYLLDMLNVTVGPLRLAPGAVGIQVAVSLVVPVLAALRPVLRGARMTPRQAISSYGLGGEFGRGPFDRLIARIRHLPRPLALSLRNTFRRKLRVALTLLALIVGGVMFVIVMSVNSSLNRTLDTVLGDFGFDVWVGFERPYRISRLTEIASSVPGVVKSEVWSYQAASLALDTPSALGPSTLGSRTRELYLWGLPTDSTLYSARLAEGRALIPGDEYALLLNQRIALDEGLHAGDNVTLTISGQESLWTVVGIVINVNNNQRDCFVSFDSLAKETASLNRGSLVMVSAEQHDPESQQALIRDLRATFAEYLAEPSSFVSAADLRQSSRSQFQVITGLMLIMAFLSAIVGSLGLMGTMSINVVERSREIGVMRTIGAASSTINRIFVTEGVLLGLMSWLLTVPPSYPGARFFSMIIGNTLKIPLTFHFSLAGVGLWLAIVAGLSALASLWPARLAANTRVIQVLRFE
jgi:putative ABC transport system permease protein